MEREKAVKPIMCRRERDLKGDYEGVDGERAILIGRRVPLTQAEPTQFYQGGWSGHTPITGGFVHEIISVSIATFHNKLAMEICRRKETNPTLKES